MAWVHYLFWDLLPVDLTPFEFFEGGTKLLLLVSRGQGGCHSPFPNPPVPWTNGNLFRGHFLDDL